MSHRICGPGLCRCDDDSPKAPRAYCLICWTKVVVDPDEDWPLCCGEPMAPIEPSEGDGDDDDLGA